MEPRHEEEEEEGVALGSGVTCYQCWFTGDAGTVICSSCRLDGDGHAGSCCWAGSAGAPALALQGRWWHGLICVPTAVPRGQRRLCVPAQLSGALLKLQGSLAGGLSLSGGDSESSCAFVGEYLL